MTDGDAGDGPDPLKAVLGAPPEDPIEQGRMFEDLQAELFGATPTPISLARYEVGERIGRGGLGVVHRGFDPELSRPVAIKLIAAPAAGTEASQPALARERLLREAQALARLSHPNVVAVYDVGTYGADDEAGGVFIVMELVEGPTLAAWLDEAKPTPREIVERYAQAARGLDAAHDAGLVHRDFKPHNAIIGSDERVRVVDFGLARGQDDVAAPTDPDESGTSASGRASVVDSSMTIPGTVMGTPAYMSPEQHRGELLGPASDQYSFCVALFEALHGVLPFTGDTSNELGRAKHTADPAPPPAGSAVSRGLQALILRGLAVRPDERHASMADLAERLEAHARGPGRWPFIAAAAVVAAGVGTALLTASDEPAPPPLSDARVELARAEQPAIASDRPTPSRATVVHADGQIDLGQARDAATDRGGRMVVSLGPDGALRRRHPDGTLELLASDVLPGLFVCGAGDRLVYAKRTDRTNRQYPDVELFVHAGEAARRIPLDPERLDRVVGLWPDCSHALVVLRAGGWPVLAAVDLVSGDPPRAFFNTALTRGAGEPDGFVPPPAAPPTWDETGRFRYEVAGQAVRHALADAVPFTAAWSELPARAAADTGKRYRLPLRSGAGYRITRYFDLGEGRDVHCGDQTFPGHGGTDLAPSPDADRTVVAAAEGRVLHAYDGEADDCDDGNCFSGAGFGNHVVLRHPDGKHTVYAHLERFSVSVARGDRVACGDVLGRVGASGPATAPHLHFEVRNAGGHTTADDPFTGPCGGPISYWTEQGDGLPADRCAEAVPAE